MKTNNFLLTLFLLLFTLSLSAQNLLEQKFLAFPAYEEGIDTSAPIFVKFFFEDEKDVTFTINNVSTTLSPHKPAIPYFKQAKWKKGLKYGSYAGFFVSGALGGFKEYLNNYSESIQGDYWKKDYSSEKATMFNDAYHTFDKLHLWSFGGTSMMFGASFVIGDHESWKLKTYTGNGFWTFLQWPPMQFLISGLSYTGGTIIGYNVPKNGKWFQ